MRIFKAHCVNGLDFVRFNWRNVFQNGIYFDIVFNCNYHAALFQVTIQIFTKAKR